MFLKLSHLSRTFRNWAVKLLGEFGLVISAFGLYLPFGARVDDVWDDDDRLPGPGDDVFQFLACQFLPLRLRFAGLLIAVKRYSKLCCVISRRS